jgi:hypothetical protein
LVIPEEHYSSEHLEPLFSILLNPEFQGVIADLPGYDVSKMGKIITENQ